ncbi:50S ribosomal protein L16 [endosymbiont GvMRE of Glomus versiforme]|uniref:50S ribosomal protein L16 n=1 Tax=endosymbiont GvMRE of Glomus versiforme TaxID=2039283 RepID=UPI000EDEFC5E|nr:50S ribosomal protein L16 [endosymbiont GvMRE of Glomus versiforme]RHZ35964.1 50S ribosomal protein L16 [endosymbiont GvMRE of Glomus versiforme]
MLIPKKTKYRFPHKISYEGKVKGNKELTWGEYGLQIQVGAWIKNNQIEAARKVIVRFLRKEGKMRINIFPHLSRTKKPLEVRMGSGKGSIDNWVAVAKNGTIMFELKEVSKEVANQALKAITYKLPKNKKRDKNIKYHYKIVEKNESK